MENKKAHQEKETQVRKKPYEKPQIVYQQKLEALAAVCGEYPGKSDGITCTMLYS